MNDTQAIEAPPAAQGVVAWLREGLRAGLLLRVRAPSLQPSAHVLVALVAIVVAVELLLGRLEVPGPADFHLRAWLAPWWSVAAAVLLFWVLLVPRTGAAAWLALWLVGTMLPSALSQVIGIAQAWQLLPPEMEASPVVGWSLFLGLWAWTLVIAVRLASQFGLARRRQGALAAGLAAIFALTAWHFPERAWSEPPAAPAEVQQMVLSEESFERQQDLFRSTVEALAPERPGVTDVYGVVFAPYAGEDVFARESQLVADLLAQRFDAQGRVVQLVNNVGTSETLPWATPRNLRRAVEAIAARMDRDNDLLVVYLTSHGASDFRLAAAHPPLKVDTLSPGELRTLLDEAGIRHRVIAISACYSGGWVGPLASDTSVVMTAADAEHTSYGCGRLSELTFFGRAVFAEQLRGTHSFEQAFAAAVPVIRQREVQAGKPDGFSNPQISVGAGIRPLLKALEQRLDAAPAARP
ncbi:MAG TPA: C13 family peptidase [Ramlibacter sp.]|nr:C13 family peptidase [Ramlibacter sp.]